MLFSGQFYSWNSHLLFALAYIHYSVSYPSHKKSEWVKHIPKQKPLESEFSNVANRVKFGLFSGVLYKSRIKSQNCAFTDFMLLDNINMLKEVNKQLQVVLEDTLFKVCDKFLTNRRKRAKKTKEKL